MQIAIKLFFPSSFPWQPLPLVCDEETGKKETCAKQYEGNDRVGSVELTEKGFVEEESTINVWHKARCNREYRQFNVFFLDTVPSRTWRSG